MKSLNFQQSHADPCIFIKRSEESDNLIVIAIYVDDLIIIASTEGEMTHVKSGLSSHFKMTDLGSLHFCLGVNMEQTEEGVILSQKQYIEKLLERYGLQDANPVSTPMDLNVKLVADDGYSKPVDRIRYKSMIGSLLYAAIATRPDISHAVGALSKFSSAPTEVHLTAVKRFLRYLKGTIGLSLQYKHTLNSEIVGFSDADWANVFMWSGGAICWLSQKQLTVAVSTAESEYIALSSAAQEAVWLQRLLVDLGEDCTQPLTIMEDNQGAIAMTNNPVQHRRTKNIDIRYHFVRGHVLNSTVQIKYCCTKNMLADLFTKPLTRGQYCLSICVTVLV